MAPIPTEESQVGFSILFMQSIFCCNLSIIALKMIENGLKTVSIAARRPIRCRKLTQASTKKALSSEDYKMHAFFFNICTYNHLLKKIGWNLSPLLLINLWWAAVITLSRVSGLNCKQEQLYQMRLIKPWVKLGITFWIQADKNQTATAICFVWWVKAWLFTLIMWCICAHWNIVLATTSTRDPLSQHCLILLNAFTYNYLVQSMLRTDPCVSKSGCVFSVPPYSRITAFKCCFHLLCLLPYFWRHTRYLLFL